MLKFIFKTASKSFVNLVFIGLSLFCLFLFSKFGVYYHPDEYNPLDMKMSYTSTYVIDYFDKLGVDGRTDYRFAVSHIDLIFPIVYGTLIILQFALLIKMLFKSNSLLFLALCILPLETVIFDYLENLNTLKMLDAFPNIIPSMAAAGTFYTSTKLYLSFICITFIITGHISVIIKKHLKKH